MPDDGKPAANEPHIESNANLDVNPLEEHVLHVDERNLRCLCLDDLLHHLMTLMLVTDENKDEELKIDVPTSCRVSAMDLR